MKTFTINEKGEIGIGVTTKKYKLDNEKEIDIIDQKEWATSNVAVHRGIHRGIFGIVDKVNLGKTQSGKPKLYDEKETDDSACIVLLIGDDIPFFNQEKETKKIAGNVYLLGSHEIFTAHGINYIYRYGKLEVLDERDE